MNKKTIWITGASSGIGEATAIKFAKEGWKVIVSARRVELLEKLSVDENIFSYPLDVTDSDKAKDVFKKIIDDHGHVDLCIFSSGTYERNSEKELDVQNIKHVIEVNFLGVINCVSAVEKYYKEKRQGVISIVSSTAGYRGLPNSTAYGPAKAALINLAESLYLDFQRYDVRVCLVSPGFIKTRLTDKNTFKMPFLKTTQYAAEQIYHGLINKNSFEIAFPRSLFLILKFFKILPNGIYLYLIRKMTKLQKK
jgi:short-subunit dehydrogenase